MSDEKKPAKRGYRAGGVTLACDIRVRVTAADSELLTRYAKKHKTTRAAAARKLLHDALQPDKN